MQILSPLVFLYFSARRWPGSSVETCNRILTVETQKKAFVNVQVDFNFILKCNIPSLEPFRTEPDLNVADPNRPFVTGSGDCLSL